MDFFGSNNESISPKVLELLLICLGSCELAFDAINDHLSERRFLASRQTDDSGEHEIRLMEETEYGLSNLLT